MAALSTQDDFKNLRALIAKIQEIAVLPHVVFKVLEITGSSESPASEIERAVIVDPGFSTKLLALANSAYYSLPRKVSTIREAVMFLGFKAVRQMAMTVGVFELFAGKSDHESLRRRSWWRHSVDTAVCCRAIALHTRKLQPDEAYTCGLLHLIGRTFLDRFGDGSYDEVEAMISAGATEISAERSVFGLVHTEASLAAAVKWGLPQSLTASLNYLVPPDPGDEFALNRACVAVATKIATAALNPERADEPPTWALELLEIDPDQYAEIVAVGLDAIAHAAELH